MVLMAVKQVNKLVRDKIPGIIGETGATPNFRLLDDKEFLDALNDKLLEEVEEYKKEKNLEELADILQVICTISEVIGGGQRELEYLRDEKAMERGRFDMHVFLESVEDKKS